MLLRVPLIIRMPQLELQKFIYYCYIMKSNYQTTHIDDTVFLRNLSAKQQPQENRFEDTIVHAKWPDALHFNTFVL